MIHSLLSRNTNIIILGNFRGFFRAVMGKVMGVGTDGQNIRVRNVQLSIKAG